MKKRPQKTDGQGDLLDSSKARDWGWVSFMWGDLQGLSKEVAGEWPGKYQEGSGLSRCAHGTFQKRTGRAKA